MKINVLIFVTAILVLVSSLATLFFVAARKPEPKPIVVPCIAQVVPTATVAPSASPSATPKVGKAVKTVVPKISK